MILTARPELAVGSGGRLRGRVQRLCEERLGVKEKALGAGGRARAAALGGAREWNHHTHGLFSYICACTKSGMGWTCNLAAKRNPQNVASHLTQRTIMIMRWQPALIIVILFNARGWGSVNQHLAARRFLALEPHRE